ncbi:Mur ligase family protein [Intrasporangium oryzae]|uniref:Mur ligase family protein n=1 Tax=Intrasporangium oryzae TaxID=412687 RepID=UPI0012F957D7|nr:Mur ligase family protein [Intrasporangium oryzae]
MTHRRDPLRAGVALGAGRVADRLSLSLGLGAGSVVGGRTALRLDPRVLEAVAAGRRSVLVTGTNGKATVTALVTAALGEKGSVVTNAMGANTTDGIIAALAKDRTSPVAALEVDDVHLGAVVKGTRPRAVIALNSSREYTRGVSLARTLRHWRRTAAALPDDSVAIINTDDPLVSWAFEAAPRVVPVSGGLDWRDDALLCPACRAPHEFEGLSWSCPGCGRQRRAPQWTVVAEGDEGDEGVEWYVEHGRGRQRIEVTVPGRTATVGEAFALAAADVFGVDLAGAAERMATVADVDERYAPVQIGEHAARLMRLDNPAGWAEALDVAATTGAQLVMVVDPDGPRDTATMWESPFHLIGGHEVAVTGGRSSDVVAILTAAGVRTRVAPDVLSAIATREAGDVLVACNTPAFRRVSAQFRGGAA